MKTTIAVLLTGSMLLSTSVAAVEVRAEAGSAMVSNQMKERRNRKVDEDERRKHGFPVIVERHISVMSINQFKELRNRKVDEDGM